ncbi:hypothetical protein ACE02U_15650 [Shewanella xiamenensis]|uniref:hypothetical protein n=1 Tax=Shewanella xiamenensis TaxID=332186 RepID=UPI0035BB015F
MTINDILSPTFITPVLVAFIGFLVAVTSSLIAKEQKVSEFRQAWINEIRKDFAKLLSKMLELNIDYNQCFLTFLEYEEKDKILDLELEKISKDLESKTRKIDDPEFKKIKTEIENLTKKQLKIKTIAEKYKSESLRLKSEVHKLDELCYSIILKLNPTKDIKIISKIHDIRSDIANSSTVKEKEIININIKNIKKKIFSFQEDIHFTLKNEWEIVKRGEKKFLIWITIGEFFIGTMIIAFYVLLALVKFPEYFPGLK